MATPPRVDRSGGVAGCWFGHCLRDASPCPADVSVTIGLWGGRECGSRMRLRLFRGARTGRRRSQASTRARLAVAEADPDELAGAGTGSQSGSGLQRARGANRRASRLPDEVVLASAPALRQTGKADEGFEPLVATSWTCCVAVVGVSRSFRLRASSWCFGRCSRNVSTTSRP